MGNAQVDIAFGELACLSTADHRLSVVRLDDQGGKTRRKCPTAEHARRSSHRLTESTIAERAEKCFASDAVRAQCGSLPEASPSECATVA